MIDPLLTGALGKSDSLALRAVSWAAGKLGGKIVDAAASGIVGLPMGPVIDALAIPSENDPKVEAWRAKRRRPPEISAEPPPVEKSMPVSLLIKAKRSKLPIHPRYAKAPSKSVVLRMAARGWLSSRHIDRADSHVAEAERLRNRLEREGGRPKRARALAGKANAHHRRAEWHYRAAELYQSLINSGVIRTKELR